MKLRDRSTWAPIVVMVATLWTLGGCKETSTTAQAASGTTSGTTHAVEKPATLESGTAIDVSLGANVSSEAVAVGDAWHGTLVENVSTGNGGTIPAGSEVNGVVTHVVAAARGSRAELELGVRSIRVDGHVTSIVATSPPVIAGSPRARNLGAIAGSAAAGALIGNAVGDGKGAVAGGVIGAAAATGVVASSKGYQVVLPTFEGPLEFFPITGE